MNQGRLIIISAPSGAGKTTIVKQLINRIKNLSFSVSACSRKKRPKEVHGRDYYFLSLEEFKKKIDNNEFLEWEEVYDGHFYGTLKKEVDQKINSGQNILLELDIVGGLKVKKIYGEKALSIFIMPPSIDVLEKRLLKRGTESSENLQKRIHKARLEIKSADQFDVIIVNDDINRAIPEAIEIVTDFIQK